MREGRKAESILWHMRQSDMALVKEARGCDEQFLRKLSIVGFNAGMLLIVCNIRWQNAAAGSRVVSSWRLPRGHQSWSCLRKRLEIIKGRSI
jgi:hypothetical protein